MAGGNSPEASKLLPYEPRASAGLRRVFGL